MRRSETRRPVVAITAMALHFAMVGSIRAQIHDITGAIDDNHRNAYGISVPDSPGAAELLKKAGLEESQKHWDDAADLYLKAVSQFPDRVVEAPNQTNQTASHYCGIAQIVLERVAKWPQDGQKSYASACAQTADDLLKAAVPGDAGALSNIYWNYFATDAGKTAGVRLMDFYIEAGDFRAAGWIGHRLLSMHPALESDRGMVLYRTALADHDAGDQTSARQLLDQLQQDDGSDVGKIAGKDVRLVDSLAVMVSAPPLIPCRLVSDADTYPSFGGRGSSGEISNSPVTLGGIQKTIPLASPEYPGTNPAQLASLVNTDRFSSSNSLATAIIPVVDDGALFFQDSRCVYAIDCNSGEPLAGWLRTYPGSGGGRYKLPAFGHARNQMLTITVSPTVVLAVLGQADCLTPAASNPLHGDAVPAPSTVKFVCLDRNTGRPLWNKTPADLPEVTATLRNAEYDGTPVIIPASIAGRGPSGILEDSVVITARTGNQNQFDECYVVCLSLKSGEFRWCTYLGGATHDIKIQRDPSQLAFANGRIFAMTNLGAVAAINPSDGQVIWLNSYARENAQSLHASALHTGRSDRPGLSSSPAWAHNPVLINDGIVFALPNDSNTLFICNADDGFSLNQLPLREWDNAQALLGANDGAVLLNSQTKVTAIDWRKYNPEHQAKDATLWAADISFLDNSTTCARGFITSGCIFVPTNHRLVQIVKGRVRKTFPPRGSFNENQSPGSILTTTNKLVVASQEQVDIYSNPAMQVTR
jgi:outer membrane protein assembly factor BamB